MENFVDIIKSSKPVLVDFFAAWCGSCKVMHPVLDELHAKVGDKARIIKIDIDKNVQLSSVNNVVSVPTFMIFKNGQLVWRESGVMSMYRLEQELAKHY